MDEPASNKLSSPKERAAVLPDALPVARWARLAAARSLLQSGARLTLALGSGGWQVAPQPFAAAEQLWMSRRRAQALGLPTAPARGHDRRVADRSDVVALALGRSAQRLAAHLADPLAQPVTGQQAGELAAVPVPPELPQLIALVKASERLPLLFAAPYQPATAGAADSELTLTTSDLTLMAEPPTVWLTAQAQLPTEDRDDARILRFLEPGPVAREHLALIFGPLRSDRPLLVRLHSKCATGDLFHSRRCDCGAQLAAARARLGAEGGLLLYLDQEGRGIGLNSKLLAYQLQDQGRDTFAANHQLGYESDERPFGLAADILRQLGVRQVRLLSNNPDKLAAVRLAGIDVIERLPLIAEADPARAGYIAAKRRAGHLFD